ncbi:type II toxin-antitoxin system Phd/YefM family antitoxin [Pseudomonas sp. TH41]|uniref:type II toxin-antitoxin system Phd/YefM family antitoxin n=1 Tax=Pseudomonas sp. TH41 TaxID=2796405 RepID=UPI00191423C9|nr:type II toxin-antitoxin system Phd/YefM family antitoxin [Pseudomonas sp. TH41]MBK5356599.1 type II toxin-antitoxin system Phd/YefM family antitoxin [Pseudomonas sp. TH41]
MQTLDIQAAKTLFSTLIDAVVDGDTIILTDGGIPVAKLSPVTNLKRRGMLSDFEFNAEASDALDNGIAKLFEGGE